MCSGELDSGQTAGIQQESDSVGLIVTGNFAEHRLGCYDLRRLRLYDWNLERDMQNNTMFVKVYIPTCLWYRLQ